MEPSTDRRICIIGAGLAGSLLALLLARRGWSIDVYEKRPDPRRQAYAGGRSINLALAERGLHALRLAGLEDLVMAQAVMMRGRMVHALDGATQLQRYGRDDSEVIWSVHRGRLNEALARAAESAGARLHFDTRLEAVDFDTRRATLADERDNSRREITFEVLLGADGAGSGLRAAMQSVTDLGEHFEPLGHGYRELEIPPAADGSFLLEPNALHIWPRGNYMCIALPNTEQTFTVTLFLPNAGDPSFATLPDLGAARKMFERDFADALALMPDFDADWQGNPVGLLGTLSLSRWRVDGQALLLGDAAHAMVPFHGQGMNCAFEDCTALDRCIAQAGDWAEAFERFEAERRPNADAIQTMALENYLEMRDHVDDADFLLQRALERILADRHPERFVPRYSMVSFLRVPYAVALERGRIQRGILVECTTGLTDIGDVDMVHADSLVSTRLSPLDRG
ncbi:NAD(P)/FAD-dependent oxidoreductase [soil metagenome]